MRELHKLTTKNLLRGNFCQACAYRHMFKDNYCNYFKKPFPKLNTCGHWRDASTLTREDFLHKTEEEFSGATVEELDKMHDL